MKNKPLIIFLIITLSIVVIALITIFINMLNGNKIFKFGYTISKELSINETFENNFKTISVNSEASLIEIKKSNSNNFKVLVYGNKDNINLTYDNDALNIETKKDFCTLICFGQKINKIEIYIPQYYENKINISNNYGDIKIADFINASMDIKNDCGDILISSIKNVSIQSSYGDISIGSLIEGDINQDCGDITIDNVSNIKATNNLGDIKINKINSYFDLSDNCGDIKIDEVNINENSKIKLDLGDVKIGLTNEIYIDAKVSLGDIKINNNHNKSDITLKIENNCGDIKVNN